MEDMPQVEYRHMHNKYVSIVNIIAVLWQIVYWDPVSIIWTTGMKTLSEILSWLTALIIVD